MKKTTAYFLLVIFSLAFTYETFNCFSKKLNSFLIEELSDFETDKHASETDKNDKKNKKKEKAETFYSCSSTSTTSLQKKHLLSSHDFLFFEIGKNSINYPPPETIVE